MIARDFECHKLKLASFVYEHSWHAEECTADWRWSLTFMFTATSALGNDAKCELHCVSVCRRESKLVT